MSDLEFAVKITRLPEAIPDRTQIRYARDLELNDLKDSNLILAGSQEADPWLAAISGQMNFVLHDDPGVGPLHVENRHPKPGEMSDYTYDPHDPQHRGLATVSFLPNLGGNGSLLAPLPHFEILLSTVEINGMASPALPLAWHTYP
jgi:hypothetical protein